MEEQQAAVQEEQQAAAQEGQVVTQPEEQPEAKPVEQNVPEAVQGHSKEVARLVNTIKGLQAKIAALESSKYEPAKDDDGKETGTVIYKGTEMSKDLAEYMAAMERGQAELTEREIKSVVENLTTSVAGMARTLRETVLGDLGNGGNTAAEQFISSVTDTAVTQALARGDELTDQLLVQKASEAVMQLKALTGIAAERQLASNATHNAVDPVTAVQTAQVAGQVNQKSYWDMTPEERRANVRAAAEYVERNRPR